MFSKTGLVNLKFFALLSLLLFIFSASFVNSIEQMMLNSEIVEMTEIASNSNLNNKNFSIEQREELEKYYIYLKNSSGEIILKRDITALKNYSDYIAILIYSANFGILIVIYIFAEILSRETREPVLKLNRYIKNINEKSIEEIPVNELPQEFHLLANTLNELLYRINNFIFSQKELFIGASHELKTPLAVIKLKNQVTLLRKRTSEEYIEVLKLTNEKIDEMNRVVSDVLNIGRQESAQFEPPVELDVIKFLNSRFRDFKILAESQDKILLSNLEPNEFYASIQETLLHQIIQNFLQNALKFTPKSKKIELISKTNSYGHLVIEVIDEGIGVDEKADLFAPFNRKGEKSGVGLGLFIAKSAADAMGSKIYVKNRVDGLNGTIAGIELKTRPVCQVSFNIGV